MRRISKNQAVGIYRILVSHIGAHEGMNNAERDKFVVAVTDLIGNRPVAYRLTSMLGMNGFFHNDGGNQNVPHVSCPSDDIDPDRRVMIEMTNAALLNLLGPETQKRFGGH